MYIRRAYVLLLRLYPRDYRAMFGREMLAAFNQAADERRSCGWIVFGQFAIDELAGLVGGAGAEWFAKLTSNRTVRGRLLPDRLRMRPPGVSWEVHYAGAFADLSSSFLPDEVDAAGRRVKLLGDRMVHAIANHDFEGARICSREERMERDHLLSLRRKRRIGE